MASVAPTLADQSGGLLGRAALITLLVALPIRLYVALHAAMVSRDSVVFIWYAQALSEDPLGEIRRQAQHPLYPALILCAHQFWETMRFLLPFLPSDPVQSWVFAGVSVTLVGGLLVVLGVYTLTCLVFNARVAVIAAWLTALAAELCQLSGNALTDMPHLAVYLFGISAGLHGLRTRRLAWLAVAGLLGGIGFLFRPEGAECAVITALAIVALARGWSWRYRLAGLVVLSLAAAAVMAPYMYLTGQVVQKKSPLKLIGAEAMVPTASPLALVGEDVGSALVKIGAHYARSLRVTYLVPVVAWFVLRRRLPAEPTAWRMLLAAALLHLCILVGLIVHYDYWTLFSLRHVMVLTALSLPFCAAGTRLLADAISSRVKHGAVAVVILALVLPTVPWMLESLHAEDAHIRRAGEWIREQQTTPPPRVMSTRFNAAYYANGVSVWSPRDEAIGPMLEQARGQRPDWVVLNEFRVLRVDRDYFATLQAALSPGETLELAHVASADKRYGGRRAMVFRYRPPS